MSSNSNDAKRDAQEGTNRLSEDVEHGMNKIKRAFVGGTGASDTASETAHHTQNKVGEVANRIVRTLHTRTTTPQTTSLFPRNLSYLSHPSSVDLFTDDSLSFSVIQQGDKLSGAATSAKDSSKD